MEGSEDLAKPKKHYAVQLALYTDILERTGFSAGRKGFIWDIHGNEVEYDFARPQSSRKSPHALGGVRGRPVTSPGHSFGAAGNARGLCRRLQAMPLAFGVPEATQGGGRSDAHSRTGAQETRCHDGKRAYGGCARESRPVGIWRGQEDNLSRDWPGHACQVLRTRQAAGGGAGRETVPEGTRGIARPRPSSCSSISKSIPCATTATCTASWSGATATAKANDSFTSSPKKRRRRPRRQAFAQAWDFIRASRPCDLLLRPLRKNHLPETPRKISRRLLRGRPGSAVRRARNGGPVHGCRPQITPNGPRTTTA